MSAVFTPEAYGAMGNGTTDDTGPLQLCFADAVQYAVSHGGAVIELAGRYGLTAQLKIEQPNVAVVGTTPIAGFNTLPGFSPPDDNAALLINYGGPFGGVAKIVATAANGDNQIVVDNPALLAAGDHVFIKYDDNASEPVDRGFITEITSINGNTVVLFDPLPFSIPAVIGGTAQGYHLKEGLRVENLTFESHAAGQTVAGLRVFGGLNGVVRNIRSKRYYTVDTGMHLDDLSIGQEYVGHYGTLFEHLHDERSGGTPTQGHSAIRFENMTACVIRGVTSLRSTGFGIHVVRVAWSDVGPLRVVKADGRGIKIYGSCSNTLHDFTSNRVSKTGIGIAAGSSHNLCGRFNAHRNGEKGFWSDGMGAVNNQLIGLQAYGNGDYDVHVGGALDKNWSMKEIRMGSGTGYFHEQARVDASLSVRPEVRARLAAAVALTANLTTKLPFNSETIDTTGSLVNGVFKPPVPGYYAITGRVGFTSAMASTCRMWISINGSVSFPCIEERDNAGLYLQAQGVVYLHASDTVQIQVNTGAAATVDHNSVRSRFDVIMI